MITIVISINGNPIMARSAVNQGEIYCGKNQGKHMYVCDDGLVVYHKRDKGVVRLAIELLKTIKE